MLSIIEVLPGSRADGADKTAARLTNLMQLTIDTSFWSRYRDPSENSCANMSRQQSDSLI